MKKFLSVFLSASFILCPLSSVFFGNNSAKAEYEIPEYVEFEENSVIATIDYNISRVSLYSAEPTLEELGITEVKQLNITPQPEFSAFSVYTEPAVCAMTLTEPGRKNVLEMINKLNSLSYIRDAQPNYIYTAYSDDTFVPNDANYGSTYQPGLQAVDPERAWYFMNENNIDCSDVVVGIIDSGINFSHEDLTGNIWTNSGEIAGDGIDNDGNGYIDDVNGWDFVTKDASGNEIPEDNDPTDENGHGSHVCGVVSAVTNNGKGIASLSRTAKVMPLRVLDAKGSGNTEAFVAAIYYAADKGVKIINGSLGSFAADQAMKTAIEKNSDVLFVFASGNFSFDNDSFGTKEWTNGSKTMTVSRSYPASFDNTNIISVAASGPYGGVGDYDTLSGFSNYGATSVDIAAPGAYIYSSNKGNSNAYTTKSGTSQASPMIASAAAMVKAAYPELTPEEIIEKLMNSGDKLLVSDGKTVKSGTRLNAYEALLIHAEEVSLNESEKTMRPGETFGLSQTVTPSNTTDKLTWTSSNEGVVVVNDGVVTAISAGSAEIMATYTGTKGSINAVCAITVEPTPEPTASPTAVPTIAPTAVPTVKPTAAPTAVPTSKPTAVPTVSPTIAPTANPTAAPTMSPTIAPTAVPTVKPTAAPTLIPTDKPILRPTAGPTPTTEPTIAPTISPTAIPTSEPTAVPTVSPTNSSTAEPTTKPTAAPTVSPTNSPTAEPISYSIQYKNGEAVITSPEAGNYVVILAEYINGALTQVKIKDAIFKEAGEIRLELPLFNNSDAEEINVMLWESLCGMKPLCGGYKAQIR